MRFIDGNRKVDLTIFGMQSSSESLVDASDSRLVHIFDEHFHLNIFKDSRSPVEREPLERYRP